MSPVSTLLRWFPDRKGLAGGLAVTALGFGGAIAATLINQLQMHFQREPTFLGPLHDVKIVTQNGIQFTADAGGALQEVVVATQADLAVLSGSWSGGLSEGVYLAGTGSTGAAASFATLGGFYCSVMMLGSALMRVPAGEFHIAANTKNTVSDLSQEQQEDFEREKALEKASFNHLEAMKTKEFYMIWGAIFGNACAGMALLSTAKTVVNDLFVAGSGIVTPAFAAQYVAFLSGAGSFGRIGWAVLSDYIGRKRVYAAFSLGIPVLASLPYVVIPMLCDATANQTNATTVPLAIFCAGTTFVVMNYGGVFSVLPSYLSDVFGQKHVGAIHGRILTAWSMAAVSGPTLLTKLREHSHHTAVKDLVQNVPDTTFKINKFRKHCIVMRYQRIAHR